MDKHSKDEMDSVDVLLQDLHIEKAQNPTPNGKKQPNPFSLKRFVFFDAYYILSNYFFPIASKNSLTKKERFLWTIQADNANK